MLKPFSLCKGPRNAKVVVVGEAPGEKEEAAQRPFVGPSGQELDRMFRKAGFNPAELFFTNVFTIRPPQNKIETFCAKKAEVGGAAYKLPPLGAGKYVRPGYLPHLDRLAEELRTVAPDFIIALGRTATWALLHQPKIGQARGTWQEECLTGRNFKVFATYHPAAVLRQWNLRVIVVRDLMKARRGPIERPSRQLLLRPTLEELEAVKEELLSAELLACDIETFKGQIDRVGFSPSPDKAICVPFFSTVYPYNNFWPTLEAEQAAWRFIRDVLESPVPKLFQNGLYDMAWLFGRYGIRLRNVEHDTMLLSHALWPELEKGLAFLATIYTDEAPWKFNYRRSVKAGEKED